MAKKAKKKVVESAIVVRLPSFLRKIVDAGLVLHVKGFHVSANVDLALLGLISVAVSVTVSPTVLKVNGAAGIGTLIGTGRFSIGTDV